MIEKSGWALLWIMALFVVGYTIAHAANVECRPKLCVIVDVRPLSDETAEIKYVCEGGETKTEVTDKLRQLMSAFSRKN